VAVTPTDVREYRGYLLNVERRQPSTVNRRLAALRKFFQWAKANALINELPTEQVKGVSAVRKAPKWLEKRDVDRLMRTVERGGSKRDLALVLLLRHTGIRVSELASLRLADLEISERKGSLQGGGQGPRAGGRQRGAGSRSRSPAEYWEDQSLCVGDSPEDRGAGRRRASSRAGARGHSLPRQDVVRRRRYDEADDETQIAKLRR